MAKEDQKPKNNFLERNGDDRSPKKGPRFNIYWIYGLIAAVLIGYQFLKISSPDLTSITEQEFKQHMLSQGDVERIDEVTK